MDDLYKMKLHDTLELGGNSKGVLVTRVPGGWIYTTYNELITGEAGFVHQNWMSDSVFVPFNTEFAKD